MSVIALLIIFSLLVAIIFLIAFIWSVKTGQYDDVHSPSVRILVDDTKRKSTQKTKNEEKNGDKNATGD